MSYIPNCRKIYTYDLIGRSQVHYLFPDTDKTAEETNPSYTMESVTEDVNIKDGNDNVANKAEIGSDVSGSQGSAVIDEDSPDVYRRSVRSELFSDFDDAAAATGHVSVSENGSGHEDRRKSASEPSQHLPQDEGSPFSWASPVQAKHASSPNFDHAGRPIPPVFQQEGALYSREVYLKTGMFDRDDEQFAGSEETSDGYRMEISEMNKQEDELSDDGQVGIREGTVRQKPEGTPSNIPSGFANSPLYHEDDESIDQSNFSLGELSMSADDYFVDEGSHLSDQAPPRRKTEMNQSLRSAMAGLAPPKPVAISTESKEETTPVQPDNNIETAESDEHQIQMGSQAGSIPFLDDSFSSEVTEHDEKLLSDPPLALLMYSQPKVWTDEAGEPTGDDEDAVSIHTEEEEDQAQIEEPGTSSAGLWMEDDMLQTIVPQKIASQQHGNEVEEAPKAEHAEENQSDSVLSMEDISGDKPENANGGADREMNQSVASERNLNGSHSISSSKGNESQTQSETSFSQSPSSPRAKRRSISRIPHMIRSSSVGAKRSGSLSKSHSEEEDSGSFIMTKGSPLNKSSPHISQIKKSATSVAFSQKISPIASKVKLSKKSQDTLPDSAKSRVTEASPGSAETEVVGANLSSQSDKKVSSSNDKVSLLQKKSPKDDGHQTNTEKTSNENDKTRERKSTKVRDHTEQKKKEKPNNEGEQTMQRKPQSQNIQVKSGEMVPAPFTSSRQASTSERPEGGRASWQVPSDPDPSPPQGRVAHHRTSEERPAHSGFTQSARHQTGFTMYTQNQIASQQAKLAQLHQTRMALIEQENMQKDTQNLTNMHKIYNYEQSFSSDIHPARINLENSISGRNSADVGAKPTQTVDELLTDVGVDVYSMEQVRSHLQNVLKQKDKSVEGDTHMLSLLSSFQEDNESSLSSNSTYPNFGPKSLADLTSHMETLASYNTVNDVAISKPRCDATVGLENQLLRENLEKEVYRRKHCEKQIHLLQSKLLEVQQQLAIAVNTDRKKDQMIEQLDKALAKVVDGWRQRESEKTDIIQRLQAENQKLTARSDAQKQLLLKFEAETTTVVDQLTAAQKTVEMAEQDREYKIAIKDRERLEAIEAMEIQREKYNTLSNEHEQLLVQAEKIRNQLIKIQTILENERDTWEDKEREYLQKIDEITDNHLSSIEQEKAKNAQQSLLLKETYEILAATQSESQELQQQLDSTSREKDSLHVQLGLLEDKMQSSLRKLDADLRCEAERNLSSKLEEAHQRQIASEEELHDRLRKQVQDLSQRHTVELKELHRQHQDDLRHKDETLTQKEMEFEETVSSKEEELESLQKYVKQLESQRQAMTSRLQTMMTMMQSHWQEALKVLTGATASDSTAALMRTLSGVYQSQSTGEDIEGRPEKSSFVQPILTSSQRVGHGSDAPPEPLHRSQSDGEEDGEKHFTALQPEELSLHQDFSNQHASFSSSFSKLPPPQQPQYSYSSSSNNPVNSTSITVSASMQGREAEGRFTHTESNNSGRMVHHFPPTSQHPFQMNVPLYNTQRPRDQPKQEGQYGSVPGQLDQSLQSMASHAESYHHGYHSHDASVASVQQRPGSSASGRQQVAARLEPSFLETLTQAAEELPGYRGTLDRSLMSEDGCVPFPQDTSVSTLNDDISYHNTAEFSFAPISDASMTMESHRYSTRLSDIAEKPHQVSPPTDQQKMMDYSGMSERFQVHEDRQKELQKYMKLLLNRSPGRPIPDNETTTAEQDLDDSYLAIAKSQPPPLQLSGAAQHAHPHGVAFNKSTVQRDLSPNTQTSATIDAAQSLGVLSPGQVGEISRLLGMYRTRASAEASSTPHNPTFGEMESYFLNKSAGAKQEATIASDINQTRGPNNTKSAPTRQVQPPGPQIQGQTQVIKVPTGTEPHSPKRSPGKPAVSGKPVPKAVAPRTSQPAGNTNNKAKSDKPLKPKAKVWK